MVRVTMRSISALLKGACPPAAWDADAPNSTAAASAALTMGCNFMALPLTQLLSPLERSSADQDHEADQSGHHQDDDQATRVSLQGRRHFIGVRVRNKKLPHSADGREQADEQGHDHRDGN